MSESECESEFKYDLSPERMAADSNLIGKWKVWFDALPEKTKEQIRTNMAVTFNSWKDRSLMDMPIAIANPREGDPNAFTLKLLKTREGTLPEGVTINFKGLHFKDVP